MISEQSVSAQICIARHGETDWNIAGILQGWTDVAINAKGREQARDMGAKFAAAGLSCVYSSPLIRARETAEIICKVLQLPPPVCHEGLKERNFGVIQGIPKSELAELNPVLLQQILSRNPECVFQQGESMDDFASRVEDTIRSIAGMHAGEQILVITHGWVFDVITREVNGLPRNAILKMKRKNGEFLWLEATETLLRPSVAKTG